MLANRTCAIAITVDMSFRTAFAADFKREYKNVDFPLEAKTRDRRRCSVASGGFTDTRKVFCFLVTRATEKRHVDPENLVLSLTRLRDFLVEREVKENLLPVYDPN